MLTIVAAPVICIIVLVDYGDLNYESMNPGRHVRSPPSMSGSAEQRTRWRQTKSHKREPDMGSAMKRSCDKTNMERCSPMEHGKVPAGSG